LIPQQQQQQQQETGVKVIGTKKQPLEKQMS